MTLSGTLCSSNFISILFTYIIIIIIFSSRSKCLNDLLQSYSVAPINNSFIPIIFASNASISHIFSCYFY